MNKKTKTMYVMQPGGFGSGATIFSSYEFEDNSASEGDRAPTVESTPKVASPTTETRNWTQAVVRLPEAFNRSVWKPLTRRVQNLGRAA